MNISYNWLKDLIEIDAPAAELASQLTRVGLAVEGIHAADDDFVFDIDLTSSRPDCLSHLGIAREIHVITERPLKIQGEVDTSEAEVPLPAVLAYDIVAVRDPDLCHRFTARIINNVKIGPSPEWLVKRLEAIGERSINNVADITNYVMHELGQPMHAFDLDKLAGRRIVVRRARSGESITTLDEVERKLDPTMLAICDEEKPVAVAGIMGGLDSSITESTRSVLLEVAYFDRASIRQASRRLNLATEASYRFERGVDIENLIVASDRASSLIREVAGGDLGEFVDMYPTKHDPIEIEAPDVIRAVKRLSGLDVEPTLCMRTLNLLGFKQKGGSPARTIFLSPSWRHDVSIEEDLVEEVVRHIGYEKIREELPPAFGAGEYQKSEPRKRRLREVLTDLGFNEAMSYSFIDTKHDNRFETVPGLTDSSLEDEFVTLRDSVIEGAVRMRPSLLPGLLDAVRLNFNHQRRNLRLFEIGRTFAAANSEDGLPTERELLSLVVTGSSEHANRAMAYAPFDFYDAKGAVEVALESIGFAAAEFVTADGLAHLQPGQSAEIAIKGRSVGSVGRLAEQITNDYKFRQPVYVAEIDLQNILSVELPPILYSSLPKYPSTVRDVSFIVTRSITFETIRTSVVAQGRELCRKVEFVDVYEGKGIGQDERSLTVRLEYRSDERTLIENEVDELHSAIVEALEKDLNIHRRF
jgi:phenylalanyl-tRNA synthetase beta chain